MHENEPKNPQMTEVDLEVKFPFSCDNSEKRFTSKESLRNQLKKIHQCQYCPQRFSMKHIVDHHIKDRHIRPNKCNICKKGFGS